MTDFQKNLSIVLFGAGLTVAGTFTANVLVIGERISNVTKAVNKLDSRFDRLDDRQRELELKQASTYASN